MLRKTISIAILFFLAALLYRAFIVFIPDKTIFESCSSTTDNHSLNFDQERLKTFQTLLQFQTISYDATHQNYSELRRCRDFIKQQYDDIIKKYSTFVQLHDIAEYSLLFAVHGTNPNLKPFLLSSHMDVVPSGHLDRWKYPPFDAHADKEFIFARGALDDKGNVFTMLEALKEYLNVYGRPSRTFYIAVTHDEEVNRLGALGVSRYLSQQPFGQKGQFEFVVDEGTVIMEDAFPTITNPLAIVGISEKGFMNVEYQVNVAPGHSSMPTSPSAIGILARAIDKLESTPQPSQFGRGPELDLLLGITPYLQFPLRVVMSNIWLFGPVIQWVLSQKPGTDALQRTTTAVTLMSGGEKDNVLPTSASANVNHRIHSGDSCRQILENNRRIINDDRVVANVKSCVEPSPISPYGKDVYAYRIIEQTIRQTFDKDRQPIIVVPGLMLGGTDSISYTTLSKNLYRYSPFIYRHDDLNRLHGDNERIRYNDVQRGLNFYFHLIVNSQLDRIPEPKLNSEL